MLVKALDKLLINKINQLERFVGNTPLFPITNLDKKENVKIFAKLEWLQLGGSVKARPAFYIIKGGILSGEISNGKIILDATSGNTGIAYAIICAKLDIPITLCLPENASTKRKSILKALGAELVLTSPFGGTDEAQSHAKDLLEKYPDKYFYADQYGNDNNWKGHYHTTAKEIYNSTSGNVSHFIAGLGTSGTFRGTMTRLKELNPDIKGIALQPDSPLHVLEGWKHMDSALKPGIYQPWLADENNIVSSETAMDLIKSTANEEGLLISPSSAANLAGALDLAEKIEQGIIVTIFPDNADNYDEIFNE